MTKSEIFGRNLNKRINVWLNSLDYEEPDYSGTLINTDGFWIYIERNKKIYYFNIDKIVRFTFDEFNNKTLFVQKNGESIKID